MTYRDKLRDSRWQKMRLRVLDRDQWRCRGQNCSSREHSHVMLVVHHTRYVRGRDPWEYDLKDLISLCQECHEAIHRPQTQGRLQTLVRGRFYLWHEIAGLIGQTPKGFLTQVNDRIVCGCFRMDLNPDAPGIVLPGRSDRQWLAKARLLQEQESSIPVFTKDEGLPWEYRGKFRVEALTQNPVEIQIHRERRKLKDVGAVMFLNPA